MNAACVARVAGTLRDRHRVDPRERARCGDDVLDVRVVDLNREHVARVGLREQQLATLQRVLVVRRDLLDLLLQVDQVVLGIVEIRRVRRVRILLQCEQRHGERVAGFVEVRRLAVDRRELERVPVGHRAVDLGLVVTDTGRSPLPRDRVLVAGVVGRVPEAGIEIHDVRDERKVERLDQVRVLHLHERRVGRDDDVVAGAAGRQLREELVVGAVVVVRDLDPGLLLEVRDRAVGDVVGPVVEVEDLRLRLVREGRRSCRSAARRSALAAATARGDEARGRGERHRSHEGSPAEMRRRGVPDEGEGYAIRIAHEVSSFSRVGSSESTTLNSGSQTRRVRVPGTPASLTRSLFWRKATRVRPASVRTTSWVDTPW